MCGRFVRTAKAQDLADLFQLAEVPAVEPRYNVAPSKTGDIVPFPGIPTKSKHGGFFLLERHERSAKAPCRSGHRCQARQHIRRLASRRTG